jgi:uncharacterized membrane protein YjjP (DUF1212 family)
LDDAPPDHSLTHEDLANYLLEIGSTLGAYGCPAYRIEDVIRAVAELEGSRAEAFALPTGLFINVTPAGSATPIHRMTRLKDWGVNLERLTLVDAIVNDVADRRITIGDARRRLKELSTRPSPYPAALTWLAIAAVSGAASIFFRGGPIEICVAAAAGLVIGVFGRFVSRNPAGRFLVDFAGGLLAGLLAWAGTRLRPHVSHEVIVLAGVINLVPGMTFTTGLAELAQKNLVAGGARLMESFVTFQSIVFGIALAVGIEHALGGSGLSVERQALGLPYQASAMVVAALGFSVIFSVPRSYLWAGGLSGATGYVATALATRYLPGHIAAFCAAAAVCMFANGLARATKRPAQLFQLPGMMLLVPGSFGFLSLENFLRGQFLDGAAKGFQMLLVAGALVMGVLVANVLLPARKLL